ncbi:hypothetical protein [Paenibacillus sp. NEAU-GSW1]|uniref:hypothetical protein n=1 Tax=Paenibacillus sp. NEAU-GSW1 TaxID=2682486 RepID=UPI0012E185EC|nr:hypothetical protein [Paenibacillus sp. NEAU-GSW1]MUT66552.1 hypothetical protein [Paenibacillus sp. NEAU-GSW1]
MSKKAILGPVFILFGAYLFLNEGSSFGTGDIFAYFWPSLFVIPLGLFFHWMYFAMTGRRGVGMLVPGGVLFTAGIVCQIAMLFNNWEYMWPGFILAPAIGLFELYWFGSRNKWLLIPINILTVLSLLFFAVFSIGAFLNEVSAMRPFLAIVFVAGGALLLIVRSRKED